MEQENDVILRFDLLDDKSDDSIPKKKTPSKFVSLTHEINDISIKNFPKSLKYQIFTFKALHYLLLIIAIVLIILKRIREHADIIAIEKIKNPTIRELFYVITGLIYVKYNLEIINFICYYTFVINLQERKSRTFYFKITVETIIILMILVKICIYIFELWSNYGFVGSISHYNIIGESIILLLHVIIVVLYCSIRQRFSHSRLLRKIFRVYYLNKELKIK